MKAKTKALATDAPALAFPELLEPISKEHPCGPDLEYDPEFVVLLAKAAPKADAQYGDFVSEPEAVNWTELERDCRRLLLRTRDIRVLLLLLRCQARMGHATGLRDGLAILAQLLARWPDAIHPQLVVDGEADPALRANALAALADPQGLMQDIRDLAIISNGALRLQMRDVERSFSVPRPADALAPESVRQRLQELRQQQNPALAALDEAMAHASSIKAWACQYLPDDQPDLEPLLKLLGFVTEPMPMTDARANPEASIVVPLVAQPTSTTANTDDGKLIEMPNEISLANTPPGRPMTRDAIRSTIRNARLWFEHHEPSSPVALLLKQAERLTGKRFDEVYQVIPADLVQRWAQDD